MTGADLYAMHQALDDKARRVAFAWTLYGQPAIPETHGECWSQLEGFRAAVAQSSADEVNAFLAGDDGEQIAFG